jgi:hypothetical protein
VCGFDYSVPFTQLLDHVAAIKPLNVLIAAITFVVTWHARKLPGRVPPIITGIAVGSGLYYLLQSLGLGAHLGPVIGSEPLPAIGLTTLPYFYDLAHVDDMRAIVPTIVAGALALAVALSLSSVRAPGCPRQCVISHAAAPSDPTPVTTCSITLTGRILLKRALRNLMRVYSAGPKSSPKLAHTSLPVPLLKAHTHTREKSEESRGF